MLAFWTHEESYYRCADGSPTGEVENYQHALQALRARYGSTPTRDFGPKRVKLLRQSMIDSRLCRRVINRRIHNIVHLFA